jgi:hypothetical protein
MAHISSQPTKPQPHHHQHLKYGEKEKQKKKKKEPRVLLHHTRFLFLYRVCFIKFRQIILARHITREISLVIVIKYPFFWSSKKKEYISNHLMKYR